MENDLARPTVTCSVLERRAADARRRIRAAPAACGLVEIRGDHLGGEEIADLVRGVARPVIVTVRAAEHGGEFNGPERQRRELLETALGAGARFVDVEHGSEAAGLAEGPHAERVILSHHGAPCRSAELLRLLDEMSASRAARLKIVPHATALDQVGAIKSLLAEARERQRPLASFATGAAGAATRLLACSWGSWTTYGAACRGAETAEGQFTVDELLETYGVLEIGAGTRLFALVGSSVRRSPSPAMHRAGYRDAGIDARYLPLEAARYDEIVSLAGPGSVLGLEAVAVTIPFKEEAARRCEPGDELSERCGAVNTVTFSSGRPRGYNTDAPGAMACIRGRLEPRGRVAAVAGAGGTARAIACALGRAGADVTLFSRGRERAERAARELGIASAPLGALVSAPWEILVNATPLGTGGERLLPATALRGRLVVDAVYGPRPTLLVSEARERGLAAIDGFELLCAQAVRQFERMTGRPAREETMAAAGMQWLSAAGP